MARCLVCGLRFLGAQPGCGHEQPPLERDSSDIPTSMDLAAIEVPGYRLTGLLGRGGFGIVADAYRESDGLPLAIKIGHRNHRDAHERLLLEVRALGEIGPPHVPELYASGVLASGAPYYVCQRLDWPTLDRKLAQWARPMKRQPFVDLADAILIALRAVHERGFIHRDLKPENIFIQESPAEAKLIDFGIAKETRDSAPNLTGIGVALGTAEYMSPEQCEGRPNIDLRTDIYAVGVVMYEMLTGRPPFFGAPAQVRAAHIGRRPPRPSRVAAVSDLFDPLILRCLAKDPSRRFADVSSLRRSLAQAGAQETESEKLTAAAAAVRGQLEKRPARERKGRQLQRMGIAFFEATASTGEVKRALASLGGQLASVEGKRCIAVFGIDAGDNPVQRAFDSAQTLIDQNLCMRALVDLDRLRVRKRPDGKVRVFASALARPERYPLTTDPPGVLLTAAAVDSLPDLRTILVREGVLREYSRHTDINTDSDATVLQMGSGELMGRDDEVEALLRSAQDALVERRPTIATVLSESGYGKSHLMAAVSSSIQRTLPLAQIIPIRCREPIGGESHLTLRALLSATMKLPRSATASSGRSLLRARLGDGVGDEVWSAVALVMGWLSADAPDVRRFRVAPSALRAAATRAAGEALRRLAATAPVCCVLDDAQFADETTLDALEYATLSEKRLPLWVCALALPHFEGARPLWGKRAAHSLTLTLGPLSSASAAELCRHLLRPAENVSGDIVRDMVEQTRGNPLLLVEMTRAIKRGGLIRQRGRGDAYFLATDELAELAHLPKVEWLAARELQTLPRELAAHARLVALLSGDVTSWEVEGVLGELEVRGLEDVFPLDAQVGLERLQGHGVLVAHRDGTYSFRHQLIRRQVAETTPEELRLEIHRAAFRFYGEATALNEHRRMPRLALHAAASGFVEQAADLYLQLADRSSLRHEYVGAELLYTRALGLLADDDERARMRALNGRGLMRYRLSRFEDALDDLEQARKLSVACDDRDAEIAILLDRATVLDWMLDYRTSKQLIEQVRDRVPEQPAPLIDARLCMAEARSHWRFDEHARAVELFERAATKAEALGDPGYETQVIALLLLGMALVTQNRADEAQASLSRVIELCQSHGDKLHLASAYSTCSYLWFTQGRLDKAVDFLLRCRQIGREIGQSELEYISSLNLGEIHYFSGDRDAAQSYLLRARQIESSNSKRSLSRLLLLRLLAWHGEVEAARQLISELEEVRVRSRESGDADAWYTESEEMLYEAARLAVSENPDDADWQALRARAEGNAPPLSRAEVLEFEGRSRLRRGDRDGATSVLREALRACANTSHLIEERIRRTLASSMPAS